MLYCGTRPNTLPPRTTRSVSPVKEEKVKVTTPNSTALSKVRHSGDHGRAAGHRMSVSSTLTSTGVKKIEDNSSGTISKSGENTARITTSDQPQSEFDSVPLKMTHVNLSESVGAKTGSDNSFQDLENVNGSKSIWTLGTNGVLTLKAPNPVTQTVATTPNLDQIKSILAQIGTTNAQNTNVASEKPADVTSSLNSGENVVLSSAEVNSNGTVTPTASTNTTVTTPSVLKTKTSVNEVQSEKSSYSSHRSAFPSLISTASAENMRSASSSVTLGLTTPAKLTNTVSSSSGAGPNTITNSSSSAPGPRSVPITTFSMTSVNAGNTNPQHERDRAETMAAYTTLAKLSSSNLPSISQTNSVVKPTSSSGNPNVRLSNVYKTTTNFENSPSLKFTSVGQSKQSLASETHIEVMPHRKHRDHFERGS